MRAKIQLPRDSIIRSTLFKMAVRIALVIIAVTAISYFHMVGNLKVQALEQLEKYVLERGQREQAIFGLAEDNHKVLKQQILQALADLGDLDPREEFDRLFVRHQDGITRNRPELFDGTRQAGVYLDRSLEIDADIRRRVLTFYRLCNSYGASWHNRFQDTYITTPENIMVIYWPEIPHWCRDATIDLYMPDEEYVWVADQKHNPERRTVWTGLFYDYVAGIWMVSCETPVDLAGRHIATIGHDITLNELFDRTINDHLEGAYNIIFRRDGRLIAHPARMQEIQDRQGYFDINNTADPHLKHILHLVEQMQPGEVVIENDQNGEYLAVTGIGGPDWYFLTVFPKSIIEKRAFVTARFILILGLISLLIEIAIVYFILRKQIAVPLLEFVRATDHVASGDREPQLDEFRQDELGRLARSFSRMRDAIQDKIAQLKTEIAERKLAEENLRQERDFSSTIIRSSPAFYVAIDRKGKTIMMNDALLRALGYTANEVVGADYLTTFIPEHERKKLSGIIRTLMRKRGSLLNRNYLLAKDGRELLVEWHGRPIFKESGEFDFFLGLGIDITDRKRAEKRIRDLNSIKEGLLISGSLHDKLKRVTDGIVEIFAADFARIWIAKKGDLCESGCYHARIEDGRIGCRHRDKCLRLMASSGRYTHLDGEVHRRVPFGRYKIGQIAADHEAKFITNDVTRDPAIHNKEWAEQLGLASFVGYRLLSPAGKPLGVLALFSKTPVTPDQDALLENLANTTAHVVQAAAAEEALRQSEKRFRDIALSMADWIWEVDENGVYTYCSDKVEDILGYSAPEILGKTPFELMPATEAERVGKIFAQIIKNREPIKDLENWNYNQDHQLIWLQTNGVPILDERGNLRGYRGVDKDITERKRAEEELHLRSEELARSNEDLEKFAYIASHDLKSPLRAISNLAQWIEEDLGEQLTGKTRRNMDLLHGRVRRMGNMIEGILQYSRIGRTGTEIEILDTGEMLRTIIDLLDPPPEFTIDIDARLPVFPTVKAPLQQVFFNLVGNAVKHHDLDHGRVEISVRDAGEFFEFSIADDGPGIPVEYRDKAFTMFQTLRPRDAVEGTGVGLALAKKILLMAGGDIQLVSGKTRGSTFVFSWPKTWKGEMKPCPIPNP